MKSIFITFLILSALGSSGYAECVYFRVSVKLLKCAPADAKALNASDPYPAAPEDPDLEDPGKEELMQVRCECEYSLRGSDLLCDVDQTVERSSVLAAEDPSHGCRRGRSLCREVCPARLP